MSSDLKVTNIKHASSGSNNLVLASDGSATINQISSSSVFPTGHILQVVNGTVTNKHPTGVSDGFTSRTSIADVRGQITITSGNYVLVHWEAYMTAYYGTANAILLASFRQGTTDADIGSDLATYGVGSTSGDTFAQISMWGLDTSPSDTTPDYVLQAQRLSSNTGNIRLLSHASTELKCTLFEIKA